MLLAALVLLGSLALSAQAANSVTDNLDTIKFTTIQQCGSFNVSFNGGNIPATSSLTLTILPFNYSTISIAISPSSWDQASGAGAHITFLPLAANTTFIATLQDADTGKFLATVSDVNIIGASDDDSCITNTSQTSQESFTLLSNPTQCESFEVGFSKSTTAPSVHALVPNFFSEPLNLTSSTNGTASYLCDVFRDFEAAFLFDDGNGNNLVSNLVPVQGDASSDSSCLNFNFTASSAVATSRSPGGLSSSGAIAIGVVSGSVVGTMLILLVFFLHRERKRRQRALENKVFVNVEKGWPEKPKRFNDDEPMTHPPDVSSPAARVIPTRISPDQPRYLADPPYSFQDYSSPTSTHHSHSATRSNDVDSRVLSSAPTVDVPRRALSHRSKYDPSNQSIDTLDIEGMLEAATIQTPRPSHISHLSSVDPSGHESGVIDGLALLPPLSVQTQNSPSVTSRVLNKKQSDENLDVPLSASDFARFSDVVMDYPREALARGDSPRARGEPFPAAEPRVRESGSEYASFRANLASRPVMKPI